MKLVFRTIASFAAFCLFTAFLAVRADAPKTETVTFPNSTGTVSGFLATPEKPGRYPALVVIHEWWGLTDWVKEQTQKLADQGYVALAVSILSKPGGKPGGDNKNFILDVVVTGFALNFFYKSLEVLYGNGAPYWTKTFLSITVPLRKSSYSGWLSFYRRYGF